MGRIRQAVGTALIAAAAAGALVACEPVETPTFTVTTLTDGIDATPGDGVCEMTAGVGDCSLRAAFGEADALGEAEIIVPTGTFELTVADPSDGDPDLDITGHVVVNRSTFRAWSVEADTSSVFEVHPGGNLIASGVRAAAAPNHAALRVEGVAALDRSVIGHLLNAWRFDGPAVDVAPGATLLLANTTVTGLGLPAALSNRGTVVARFSTITGYFTAGLHTAEGASTTLGASHVSFGRLGGVSLMGVPTGPACVGSAPISEGHNRSIDGTCALTGPSDVEGPSSSWVDLVPPGTLGCGGEYSADVGNQVRPVDGNGDGVVGCDAGSEENGRSLAPPNLYLNPRTATQGRCYAGHLVSLVDLEHETWAVTGLPAGLTVDDDRIVGAPTEAGSFPIEAIMTAPGGGGRFTATIEVAPGTPPWDLGCV